MNQTIKYLLISIISIILGAILSSFLPACISFSGSDSNQSRKFSAQLNQIIVRDTTLKLVESPPLIISKVKPKIKILKDTIITFQPFTASVDTIIKHDTIRSSFEFPSNNFSLEIKRKPDTVRIERIILQPPVSAKETWWVKPAIFAGGILSGMLIKTITK